MKINQIRKINAKLNDKGAVYTITNTQNRKVYVGSSIHIYTRWKEHIRDLNNNEHHSKALQDDYNLLNEDVFEFNVLEYESDREKLFALEQEYIDKLKSEYNTYKCLLTVEYESVKYELKEFCEKYDLNYEFTKARYLQGYKVEDLFKSTEQLMIDNDTLIVVTIDDKEYTLKQAEKEFGIAYDTIKKRYYKGKKNRELIEQVKTENLLTAKDLDVIVKKINEGSSLLDIAEEYSVSNATVSLFLKANNVDFYKEYHKNRNEKILQLHEQKVKNKDIASMFKIASSYVSQILKKWQISTSIS